MSNNPYAPPQAPVEETLGADGPAPDYRLYTPAQITIAGFLGLPLAASWFIACNYRAFGYSTTAIRATFIGGFASMGVVFAVVACERWILAWVLPWVLVILFAVTGAAIFAIAQSLFGQVVLAHRRASGPLGEWWKVIVLSPFWGIAAIVGTMLVALRFGLAAYG